MLVGLQAYTQDSLRLKTESWFLEGKIFKEIHYDILGRRVLEWQQKKRIPINSRDEITKIDYNSASRVWIQRTLNGKVNKKGKIIFSEGGEFLGIDFISQYDSVTNRIWTRYERLGTVESKKNKMFISEAWNAQFSVSQVQDFNSFCTEVIDSTTSYKKMLSYRDQYFSGSHYQTERISYESYKSESSLINKRVDSSFSDNRLNSVSITIYQDSLQSRTTHWLIGTGESYSRTDYIVENDTLRKSINYKSKLDKKDFEKPFKVDYKIDYEYPHPTLERQLISKGKKKYHVEIRKQFY